ncbi:hypothetical protein M501DRAFT_943631, partial [Patellaria atrata CBS 101060]
NIKKSEFYIIKIKFFSFIISINEIAIDLEKTKILLINIKGILSFNKFYNFYRKFLEKFGRVIRLLTI